MATAANTAKSPRRRRVLTFLGAVLMLVLGAAISNLVPRTIDHIFPASQVEMPLITTTQNSFNGATYFVHRPDAAIIEREKAECRNVTDDSYTCNQHAISRAGGIPELGIAIVTITNPQTASLVVTGLRTVVEERRHVAFAMKVIPEMGGPIGTCFTFDLDQATSSAVLVEDEEGDPAQILGRKDSHAFFSRKQFEVPPGRSEALVIRPVSRFAGIIRWHLEIDYSSRDYDGTITQNHGVLRPAGDSYIGVPATTKAKMEAPNL